MKREELKQIIRESVHEVLAEETGLTKVFDKTASKYKDLLLKKQKLVDDFIKLSPEDRVKGKEKYIEKLKDINSKIKEMEDKFSSAVRNMKAPSEDELI